MKVRGQGHHHHNTFPIASGPDIDGEALIKGVF